LLMGLTAALLQPQSIACGGSDERDPWSDDGGKGGDGNIGSAYGVGPSTGGFGPSTGGLGGDGNIGSAYGVGPSTGGFGAGGEGGEGGAGEGGLGEGGAADGGAQDGGAGG